MTDIVCIKADRYILAQTQNRQVSFETCRFFFLPMASYGGIVSFFYNLKKRRILMRDRDFLTENEVIQGVENFLKQKGRTSHKRVIYKADAEKRNMALI